MATSRCRCRKRRRCWCASTPWRSARPISKSSITARRPRSKAACRSTRTSLPAMNTWARWWRSAPASTNTRSASASPSRSTPAAASASAAARACTPSCHNYGLNYGDVDKGHRANGFTTDGGFCEYQVNNINTLVAHPRRDVGRGGHARRHRRHRHVCAHRTGRAGCRRKRLRHRPGPDRADGRCRCQGPRRAAGDPHRHPRQPARDRQGARRRRRDQCPQGSPMSWPR